jgi:predicted transcriptional regulator
MSEGDGGHDYRKIERWMFEPTRMAVVQAFVEDIGHPVTLDEVAVGTGRNRQHCAMALMRLHNKGLVTRRKIPAVRTNGRWGKPHSSNRTVFIYEPVGFDDQQE